MIWAILFVALMAQVGGDPPPERLPERPIKNPTIYREFTAEDREELIGLIDQIEFTHHRARGKMYQGRTITIARYDDPVVGVPLLVIYTNVERP